MVKKSTGSESGTITDIQHILPLEMWGMIAKYLTHKERLSLRLVSRQFANRVLPAYTLWETHYVGVHASNKKEYFNQSLAIVKEIVSWASKKNPVSNEFTAYVVARYGAKTQADFFQWLPEVYRKSEHVISALFYYDKGLTNRVYQSIPEDHKSEQLLTKICQQMTYCARNYEESEDMIASIRTTAVQKGYEDHTLLYTLLEDNITETLQSWGHIIQDDNFLKGYFRARQHQSSSIVTAKLLLENVILLDQLDVWETIATTIAPSSIEKGGIDELRSAAFIINYLIAWPQCLSNPVCHKWIKDLLDFPSIQGCMIQLSNNSLIVFQAYQALQNAPDPQALQNAQAPQIPLRANSAP